jgi:signal peptide peptidase SppA
MPNQTLSLPHSVLPNASSELAGVPYLDQYWGEWALYEPFARFLLSHVENMNVQVHVAEQKASGGNGGGRRGDVYVDSDGIAHIELSGTLMKHVSSMSAGTSTALARRQVRAATASADVRGILLIVDSPGGTVSGTADLAADIRMAATKKPIHSFIEDLGASAGYWLPSQAQHVTINPTGLAGSIGVFQVVEDWSKYAEKEGVKVHVVRFGEMKGLGTPGTAVTEEQLAYLQERIDSIGADFVAAIAAGRKMSIEKARSLADGRVHKGEAAKKLGLVDAVGSIDDALTTLKAQINRPSSRGTRMSEQAAAVATELKTSAATIAELRENCVGASAEFIIDAMEKQLTLPQALKAHAAAVAEQNKQLAKERDELKAKQAEAEKANAKPARGVAPIGGKGDEEAADKYDGLTANEFMQLKINERVEKGMKRDAAAASVFRAYPQLREDVVAEANERRRHVA